MIKTLRDKMYDNATVAVIRDGMTVVAAAAEYGVDPALLAVRVTPRSYAEQDYRDFGEEQGFQWDESGSLKGLACFDHNGTTIVNPYSHTQGDPRELFGQNFGAWKTMAAVLMRGF